MARPRSTVVPFRRPFRAVPLRAVRKPPQKPRETLRITPIMAMLPLAAFTAVFLYEGTPPDAALDHESAVFPLCSDSARVTCVVDGDTFWYLGDKIRIADINTPEVSQPACAREAELGAQATGRMLALLNQGPFTLELNGRDRDRYGRLLRTVTRNGQSLGAVLVREGLAEEWQGRRGVWC